VLRGRSALETGLILLPLAIAAAITTPIAGRLYDKIGPRLLIIVGFGVLGINTWQLSNIQADTAISTILFLLALRGVALGMTVQTTFATALGAVPKQALARGSSLINGTRFVVQSIGVAILATVLSSSLSSQTREFQESAGENTAAIAQIGTATGQPTTPQRFGLCETPGVPAAQNIPSGVPPAAQSQVRAGIQQACSEYVAGFEATYKLTFYFALIAMVIGAFLPGWPLKWAGRGVVADAPPTPAH
jgi:DHA2 family multidrug resistance protein